MRSPEAAAAQSKKKWPVNLALFAVLVLLILACLCVGKYALSPGECLRILTGGLFGGQEGVDPMDRSMLLGVRLPRTMAAVIVGAALALSGAVYQSIFKNPLVSPDFLGVSAGACVGAAIAILLSMAAVMVQAFAFAGGILAVGLTVLIPGLLRSDSNIMLVLAGIIVSGAMTSVLGFIKYIADPQTQLAAITYWQLGSFAYVDSRTILSILPLSIAAAVVLLLLAWWINVLSLGEQEARSLAFRTEHLVSFPCKRLLSPHPGAVNGFVPAGNARLALDLRGQGGEIKGSLESEPSLGLEMSERQACQHLL